jgi:molybdenum cofactor cytidylyltransferase
MGVGGLLTEIASRPQPRDVEVQAAPHAPRIAAIVLAAGLGSRMGGNKLTARLAGKAMLLHAVDAALKSHASQVIVVTGNDERNVRSTLDGMHVHIVHNPDFRDGLSTSLKAGIRAVSEQSDGAIVLLGDMPGIVAPLLDRMIAAFDPQEGRAICVAAHARKRGNPVLWARQFFPDILTLQGDVGARHLIAANEEAVCEIEAGSDAPLVDIDTEDARAAYEARTI